MLRIWYNVANLIDDGTNIIYSNSEQTNYLLPIVAVVHVRLMFRICHNNSFGIMNYNSKRVMKFESALSTHSDALSMTISIVFSYLYECK